MDAVQTWKLPYTAATSGSHTQRIQHNPEVFRRLSAPRRHTGTCMFFFFHKESNESITYMRNLKVHQTHAQAKYTNTCPNAPADHQTPCPRTPSLSVFTRSLTNGTNHCLLAHLLSMFCYKQIMWVWHREDVLPNCAWHIKCSNKKWKEYCAWILQYSNELTEPWNMQYATKWCCEALIVVCWIPIY